MILLQKIVFTFILAFSMNTFSAGKVIITSYNNKRHHKGDFSKLLQKINAGEYQNYFTPQGYEIVNISSWTNSMATDFNWFRPGNKPFIVAQNLIKAEEALWNYVGKIVDHPNNNYLHFIYSWKPVGIKRYDFEPDHHETVEETGFNQFAFYNELTGEEIVFGPNKTRNQIFREVITLFHLLRSESALDSFEFSILQKALKDDQN